MADETHRAEPDPPAEPTVNADGGQGQGGYGPNDGAAFSPRDYRHPAAGEGASKSVAHVMRETGEFIDGPKAVFKMNHENTGCDCSGCVWPDSLKGLKVDICENGIRHVTWEMTRRRTAAAFFAARTVTELASWTDFPLEDQGRLTGPMSYDAASDRYVPISWDDACAMVGEALRGLESPDRAAFSTSGRLGNEATFLYQPLARE